MSEAPKDHPNRQEIGALIDYLAARYDLPEHVVGSMRAADRVRFDVNKSLNTINIKCAGQAVSSKHLVMLAPES